MKNIIQEGVTLTLIAPYAVASGAMFKLGSIHAVAANAAANAAEVVGIVLGIFDLAKLGTDVVAVGDLMYWDNTAKLTTKVVGTNTKVGYATSAAGNGVLTVNIRLVPTI